MILILGESNRNCLLASRIYEERFPDGRHPRERAFRSLLDRFINSGSVSYNKRNVPGLVVNDQENEFAVMTAIVEDPNQSTRRLSRELGISRSSVICIIKKNNYHPYHVQIHQELSDEDFGRRLFFLSVDERQNARRPKFFEYSYVL